MPVESRQLPLYFHAVQSNKYRDEYDRIFGKKKIEDETVVLEIPTDNVAPEKQEQKVPPKQ